METMNMSQHKLRYGVAYYDEYMPYDRLDQDIAMMLAAGITTVRIAESTWSTLEPQNGVFDFRSIDRVLAAMHQAGIEVIIGTPTYAVPTWLVREHPEVLAITPAGPNKYGPRQNMDITCPAYLFHAERVIHQLISHVANHPAVIGYQADNETKHYNTCGPNVQAAFVAWMRNKYPSLDELNHRLGLSYWSNRINSWDDFPSVDASINASLKGEFAKFQRQLVTDFLAWQVDIINEYKQPGQFVTQNFDFDWRGYSYGIQPDVDHFAAAQAFDIAGVDIYHPSQDNLTGIEISFGGDVARSMKGGNYLVLETEAQAFANWTPYPGQLRLQAFSHVASGANMVAYWHYHSIHNSFETYWKGLLSQDFAPNPTYNEAVTIGRDFARLGGQLADLKITNKAAILVSNDSLKALESFNPFMQINYNDVVRAFYDTLYRLNVGCDFIPPETDSNKLESYQLIVVPALYAASDDLLQRLNRFVEKGGHVVYGYRSGFSNEEVQVRAEVQPGIIRDACGVSYSQFVFADKVALKDNPFGVSSAENQIQGFMELLVPQTAEVLAWYDHPYWGSYAAVTRNTYGQGRATYFGCLPSPAVLDKIIAATVREAGLWGNEQSLQFPLITKKGVNAAGKTIRYYFNYSSRPTAVKHIGLPGIELVSGYPVTAWESMQLSDWGFKIIEEA
jgi:beta-galactosidase